MKTLRERLGALPDGRCLVGFSGGADSTAMMLLLAEERDAGRIQPEAVHVNHGLRGAESEDDEAFCRDLSKKLGIRLHTERAELNGKRDENSCREERFRCFRKIMAETGIRSLVLAHNRDDLAETFLMRLLRGAGTEGLACMSGRDKQADCTIYRPMLEIGREEIRRALIQRGIQWREDSLNESDAYLRNRIRRKLLPLMNELSEGATGRIARTAKILTGENQVLQSLAECFLEDHSEGYTIEAQMLCKQPAALQNRILRTWWMKNSPEREEHTLSARQTEELASLVNAERGKVNLPGGMHAVKGRQGMYLTGLPKTVPAEIPFESAIPGKLLFGNVVLETGWSEGSPGNGITEQEVPADFLRGCVIRTRREGDRIRPFGMEGTRKLQDYLTDRGIDEPMRDEIPLICRGNEVLLAAGIGAGAVPGWSADVINIRVKWRGRMPWKLKERKKTEDGS